MADKPEDPFEWEKNYIQEMFGIDPGILVDDDNDAYIFVKSGTEIRVAPLSDDMTSIEQELKDVEELPAENKPRLYCKIRCQRVGDYRRNTLFLSSAYAHSPQWHKRA